MRPTRAMVLAAGLGSRLRPLTDAVPKPMLPVRGKPLLEHHVEALAAAGVREIVINLHHLPAVIVDHFGDGQRWGVRITYSHEPELLGTAGAVKRVAHLFPEPFFVLYGDNYLRCDLVALAGLHERAGAVASLALFGLPDVSRSGVAEVAPDGRILRFVEKPRPGETESRLVNAGAYVLSPEALDWVPAGGPADFGRDVFPAMVAGGARLYGFVMPEGGVEGADSPELYRRLTAAAGGTGAPWRARGARDG